MIDNNANYRAIFCKRLREIRIDKNISQKKLGILMGIDEFVAGTRINRYEKGVHEPDINTIGRLSKVLNIPTAYFFADDELAKIILEYNNKEEVKN